MGIFLNIFLLNFLSFFVKPVVPITTFFLISKQFLKPLRVHFGNVKSIITFAFLNALGVLSSGLIPFIFF